MAALVALVASSLCASSPSFVLGEALPVAAISTVMSFFLGKLSSGSDSGLSAADQIKVQREKQKTTRETRKTVEAEKKASDAKTKELTKESEARAKESEAKAKESEAKAKELAIMLQESKASRELENAKQETIKRHNQEVVLESCVSVVKAGAMVLIGRKGLIEWQKFIDFQREQKKKTEMDELELEQKSEMFQMTQKHMSQTYWWSLFKTQADIFSNTICKLVAASVLAYMAYHHVKSTRCNQNQRNAIMSMHHFAIAIA